ncbi:hypothetical protein ACWDYH_38315 [Nocardia goodfellowii]
MQTSSTQWGMLLTAIVAAILTAITVHINYRKHRVEERARGRKSIRRRREQVDAWKAEIERLGDCCPPELTYDYDLARRWLAAEYAVQVTSEENTCQYRFVAWVLYPVVFLTVVFYQFLDDSHWMRLVAGVMYWGSFAGLSLTMLALKNPQWRVERQRMLYARLGNRDGLPQIRLVTSNPLVARVPNWRAVNRWIVEITGPQTDIAAVTDKHLRAIQHAIDDWYVTRKSHRLQQWLAEAGTKVRDRAQDRFSLRWL